MRHAGRAILPIAARVLSCKVPAAVDRNDDDAGLYYETGDEAAVVDGTGRGLETEGADDVA